MLSFTDCLDANNKIGYSILKAYRYGLSAPSPNQSNQLLNVIKKYEFTKYMDRKMEYNTLSMDFDDFVPYLSDSIKLKKNFNKLETFFCSGRKNPKIYYLSLKDRFYNLSMERKIMFINIGIDKYSIDRCEHSNYSVHGVCVVLIPVKNNSYNMYYINSHGCAMKDTVYYETIKTKTRINRYDFTDPVDMYVMEAMKNYLSESCDVNIYYDRSPTYNYLGVNLQEGDYHGVCFIYPIAVYFGLGKYFTEKKALSCDGVTRYVPTIKSLLLEGNINLAIESCFTDFDDSFQYIIFKSLFERATKKNRKTLKPLMECVEKLGTRFVKKILNTYVLLLSQKAITSKIEIE